MCCDPPAQTPNNELLEWAFRSLRAARYRMLADSEAVLEAIQTLERVTGFNYETAQPIAGNLHDRLHSLGKFLDPVLSKDERIDYSRLARVARENRNTQVHEGAKARNTNRILLNLFLLLEDAFLRMMSPIVKTYMVTEVMTAEQWQPLKHVRQRMLENSFTWMPILLNGKWCFIGDFAIFEVLKDLSTNERKNKLNLPLIDFQDRSMFTETRWTDPTEEIANLKFSAASVPYLVRPEKESPSEQICGIITSFDLL